MDPIVPRRKKQKTEGVSFFNPPPPDQPPDAALEPHTIFTQGAPPRETYLSVPPSPQKRTARTIVSQTPVNIEEVVQDNFLPLSLDYLSPEDPGSGEYEDDIVHPRSQKPTDNPFLLFIPLIDTFVSELLRLEVPFVHDSSPVCSGCSAVVCNKENRGFRCRTCMPGLLYCAPCIVDAHRHLPLHNVEAWIDGFMQQVSLKDLGVRIQLGSHSGPCPSPRRPTEDKFTIIHSGGIASVGLDFCGCASSTSHFIQLLRHRLFPATVGEPQTAATFDVLENFQMLSFTSKISAFDFVTALQCRTDNTGTAPVPDRYRSFLRIMRIWRHVRLLKRSGRGFEPEAATAPGSCAVVCPACPMPGINLPDGWEQAAAGRSFIYRLFIAVDANFRLRRKDVSSEERDPGLNQGHAFIVGETRFKEHLAEFGEVITEDKSTCNNHDAIKSASVRGGRGTAASGVGIAQCSRHDMRRPEGAGDLQKGERYVNMDYFVTSTLRHNPPCEVVVSYDIACQWSKKFPARCSQYPSHLNPFDCGTSFFYYVPKFHLPAHVASCRTSYSLNYAPGVGRTDGELPERGWSSTNDLAYSTHEMGPGSRRDTLDDNFGDANWLKVTHMAQSLLTGGLEAVKKRQDQVLAFLAFSAGLPDENVARWTKEVQAWERDLSKPNPFVSTSKVLTQNAVRLKLANEDAAALQEGSIVPAHGDVTPSTFIRLGIELEEAQHKLAIDVKCLGTHSTDLSRSKVAERGNSIRRRIDAWFTMQTSFMPSISAMRVARNEEANGPSVPAFATALFLPSSVCSTVALDLRFVRYEQEFRQAQGETILRDLRTLLLLRSHMLLSKRRYSHGYNRTTRSNKLIDEIKEKINNLVAQYQVVRACLINLSLVTGDNAWEGTVQVLRDEDVRGMTGEHEGGEGAKQLTWIWTVKGSEDEADATTSSDMRIEWCKARARAHRWQEECLLVEEEMRRFLAFFDWDRDRWQRRAAWVSNHANIVAPAVNELNSMGENYKEDVLSLFTLIAGKVSYAQKQSNIRYRISTRAKALWAENRGELLRMDEGRDPYVLVEADTS
ncbi:hypothetical protein BKA70DRAFT_1419261 [Coprinopsis sp. MPI-PUGE-AT-0042]|nr:hypothetical protein BKA70DRAFT_1419261 [Coprinopsis sp. MPI-PUGE-AT-0042]